MIIRFRSARRGRGPPDGSGVGRPRWNPEADLGPTPLAALDPQRAAVGLDDLPAQRQADPAAGLLGRVEREQRVAHHLLAHPSTAIGNTNARTTVGHPGHADGDPRRPDEAIEVALDWALVVRGDSDGTGDEARVPERELEATGPFERVTTGNDEIVGFVADALEERRIAREKDAPKQDVPAYVHDI